MAFVAAPLGNECADGAGIYSAWPGARDTARQVGRRQGPAQYVAQAAADTVKPGSHGGADLAPVGQAIFPQEANGLITCKPVKSHAREGTHTAPVEDILVRADSKRLGR